MGERDSEAADLCAVLSGEDMLGSAVELARDFAQRFDLASADEARLCILVEELAANLADHGTPGPTPATLALARLPGCIRIVLTDSGAPFDPRAAPAEPRPQARGGGAGLAIVRAWGRIADYRQEGGGNRLEVHLPLTAGPDRPEAR